MIDLSNQVALVTGGSRGIGAATALMLAHAGADVMVMYAKRKHDADRVVGNIRNLGRKSFAYQGYLQDYARCKQVVSKVLKNFGRIDILVNNGGIWEYGDIAKMTSEQWKKTIDINLTGTFNMCRLAVPAMKKQGYGRIINVSSTAGQRGEAFHSHYAAAKGGVIAFSKSIAVELIKYNIWVNCIAPGWVETDMTSGVLKNSIQKKEILKVIPRLRLAIPEEIAGPIVFLASSLSNHIIGEVLNVNGGSVLCG